MTEDRGRIRTNAIKLHKIIDGDILANDFVEKDRWPMTDSDKW